MSFKIIEMDKEKSSNPFTSCRSSRTKEGMKSEVLDSLVEGHA